MTLVREFDLFLTAGKSIPLVINANQYDQGEMWVFTLYTDSGVQYTPETGAVVGVKSDGHGILNEATVNESGQVVVTETQQMTAAVGKNIYELLIDDETHGTANFVVLVEQSPQDGIVLSDSDLSYIENIISSGGGMSDDVKQALLQIAEKIAYIDENGQDYYDDLYDALYPPIVVTAITLNTNSLSFGTLNATQQLTATTTPVGGEVTWSSSDTSIATVSQTGVVTSVAYGNATITATSGSVSATCSVAITQATVSSISAVYTQSGTVYNTDSLDSLKADLVVTATWSDSSTSTVASGDYTLSGTLAEGTSTITVTYGGKTDTFTVTVTERGALYPLENGTWDSEATNPVYRITVSNGNHVKFESLRGVSQQSFANLHDGGLSNSATIINNLSELFVIPANAEATLTISNVVNSNSVSFNCNFRKANASTSGSFGIGDGAHLSGEIVTKTLSADESVSCAFFYHPQAIATVGSVIEFDMSFTVNGVKYI